jgi:7-cyano-7-deazaguanine reductase
MPNLNSAKAFTCLHVCPEVTSVCPVTRQPDFATLRIEYQPAKLLVELKSLRDYLVSFRDAETFHEELLNRIYDDFTQTVNPAWVSMWLEVAVRGGIESVISRTSGPRSELRPTVVLTQG